MSITAASAVTASQLQTQIQASVLTKMMKTVQDHQKQTAGMIEAAIKVVREMQTTEKDKGAIVDVFA